MFRGFNALWKGCDGQTSFRCLDKHVLSSGQIYNMTVSENKTRLLFSGWGEKCWSQNLQLVLDLFFTLSCLQEEGILSVMGVSIKWIYCSHRSSGNHKKQKQMSHCLVTCGLSRKLRSAICANHIIYLPPTSSPHSLIMSFSLKNLTAVLGEHNWTYLRSHPVVFVWIYVQRNINRSLIDWRSPYLFWSILVARAQ